LAEVLNDLPGLKVRLESWWRAPEVEAVFDAAFKQPGGHADAGETSAILAIRPDVVRLDRVACTPDAPFPDFLTVETFLECFPHGVIGGDPRVGSALVGDQAIEASAQVCVRWLSR
jgi:creatinine amidohydrolase/Fe(II)-dependent formamide hydrolase-like protein